MIPATSAVGIIDRLYRSLYNGGCPDESQGFHFDRASDRGRDHRHFGRDRDSEVRQHEGKGLSRVDEDRKRTRLNSSHGYLSHVVFCLDKTGYGVLDDQWRGWPD